MAETDPVRQERFILRSEGLDLRVFAAVPANEEVASPCVQIHHGGGGFGPLYEQMAEQLARHGILGVALIHRGYPGSEGCQQYGKGEVRDIGNLSEELRRRFDVDSERMAIIGYSRGAHSALLALERYRDFCAGVLWSPPVDMARHVRVHPWIQDIIGGSPGHVPEEYACRSPLGAVEQISCPVLILHGEQDDVVPAEHSRLLAAALKAEGKTFELEFMPGEGHVWSQGGLLTVWRRTGAFLERYLMAET